MVFGSWILLSDKACDLFCKVYANTAQSAWHVFIIGGHEFVLFCLESVHRGMNTSDNYLGIFSLDVLFPLLKNLHSSNHFSLSSAARPGAQSQYRRGDLPAGCRLKIAFTAGRYGRYVTQYSVTVTQEKNWVYGSCVLYFSNTDLGRVFVWAANARAGRRDNVGMAEWVAFVGESYCCFSIVVVDAILKKIPRYRIHAISNLF